jgi:hypothetical protein
VHFSSGPTGSAGNRAKPDHSSKGAVSVCVSKATDRNTSSQTAVLRHRLGKRRAAAGDEPRDQDGGDQEPDRDRDWALDIDPGIALAQEQRLAKMLLDVRPENEADTSGASWNFILLKK